MVGDSARGKEKVDRAEKHMTGLQGIEKICGNLNGRFILGCVTPTAETGVFVRALHRAGVDMSWCSDNRFASNNHVVAHLQSEGVRIYASSDMTLDEHFANMDKALFHAHGDIQVVSDGADILEYMARIHHPLLPQVSGITEQTACGIPILKRLYDAKSINATTFDIDGTEAKKYFDNYRGVRMTMTCTFELCDIDVTDKIVTVFGYGSVGRAAADAMITRDATRPIQIVEHDPMRLYLAEQKRLCRPVHKTEAMRTSDICITATGADDTIDRKMIESAKDGICLCNIGHGQSEYDFNYLKENGVCRVINKHVEEYTLPSGKKVLSLCQGALANMIVCGGSLPDAMGITFTLHALGQLELAQSGREKIVGVVPMPSYITREALLRNFPHLRSAIEG